jgi:hypothetical protein
MNYQSTILQCAFSLILTCLPLLKCKLINSVDLSVVPILNLATTDKQYTPNLNSYNVDYLPCTHEKEGVQ